MLIRKHKSDESSLIDFLSSAPAAWNPDSDKVMTTDEIMEVDPYRPHSGRTCQSFTPVMQHTSS